MHADGISTHRVYSLPHGTLYVWDGAAGERPETSILLNGLEPQWEKRTRASAAATILWARRNGKLRYRESVRNVWEGGRVVRSAAKVTRDERGLIPSYALCSRDYFTHVGRGTCPECGR